MPSKTQMDRLLTEQLRKFQGPLLSTGTQYWVDSATGSSSYDGKSWKKPLATIDQAINKCTANKGDIIWVMPNHAETLSASTSMACDVAGISIIGLGRGSQRPALTLSNASARIDVSAADITLENLFITASTSAIVRALYIKGDYTHVKDCEISATGASHILVGIEIGATNNDADGTTVEGCKIYQADSASTNAILFMKDQVGVTLENNFCQGDYAVGGIVGVIAANSAENLTNVLLRRNVCVSAAADQAIAINLDGPSNTGMLVENYAYAPDADWTPFIAAGCGFMENYESGGTSGGDLYPL